MKIAECLNESDEDIITALIDEDFEIIDAAIRAESRLKMLESDIHELARNEFNCFVKCVREEKSLIFIFINTFV